MKKTITALFAGLTAILAAGSVLALDLEVWGEFKTGLYTEERTLRDIIIDRSMIHNNDGDSGDEEGRIRFGLGLAQGNFGLRTQFFQDSFTRKTSASDPNIVRVGVYYAYAYGNILDNQIKISAGLLGESPWGSGGPELFRELEYMAEGTPLMGMRFEYKPTFLSFLEGLNIGFVLTHADTAVPPGAVRTFGDMLKESVVGIAWEHEYFAFRFAYRFDCDFQAPASKFFGAMFLYRVEERILGKLLPGLSVSANGYRIGIGAAGSAARNVSRYLQNWIYAKYDPEYFTAGVTIGYLDDYEYKGQKLELKPYFYWKLLNNILSVGAMGGLEMGEGSGKSFKEDGDPFYNYWFIEPQIRVNITSNFYTAIVYRYTSGEFGGTADKDLQAHWVNLRVCYTF